MTRQPFAHQDASGAAGAPLAVFVGGKFHAYVDTTTDPYGSAAAEKLAGELSAKHAGSRRPSVEVSTTCINHPQTAAVDCLICDPED